MTFSKRTSERSERHGQLSGLYGLLPQQIQYYRLPLARVDQTMDLARSNRWPSPQYRSRRALPSRLLLTAFRSLWLDNNLLPKMPCQKRSFVPVFSAPRKTNRLDVPKTPGKIFAILAGFWPRRVRASVAGGRGKEPKPANSHSGWARILSSFPVGSQI